MDLPPSYPTAAAALPASSGLGVAIGLLRIAASGVVLLVALPAVLLATLLPGRWYGARAPLWVVTGVCRAFLRLSGLRLSVQNPDAFRDTRGFVFFNHVSYLDVPVLLAVRPFRFLAAAGVRRIPVIGWIARAVRTVFVHRGDGASREAARLELIEAARRSPTPIALAPEGGVKHGPLVQPFRYGAFEVAAETDSDILLVALDYTPRGYAAWVDGEGLLAGYWRLASCTQQVDVRIVPLPPSFRLTAPPDRAATEAENVINQALQKIWSATLHHPDR